MPYVYNIPPNLYTCENSLVQKVLKYVLAQRVFSHGHCAKQQQQQQKTTYWQPAAYIWYDLYNEYIQLITFIQSM